MQAASIGQRASSLGATMPGMELSETKPWQCASKARAVGEHRLLMTRIRRHVSVKWFMRESQHPARRATREIPYPCMQGDAHRFADFQFAQSRALHSLRLRAFGFVSFLET